MKRQLTVLFLLVSLLIVAVHQFVFASGAEQQTQLAIPILVANTSFLNVRSGDGPQYTILETVVGGTELPVLGMNSNGTWYLVTTAVGSGWVDVSLTLARGDFRNIPVLQPNFGSPPPMQTPLTIGLPSTAAVAPITAAPQTGIQTITYAALNVTSVNLRTQPREDGSVLDLLFKADNINYPIVGYAYDDQNIPWVAIVVPNIGTGWIEAPKIILEQSTVVLPGTVINGVTTGETATTSSPTQVGGFPIPELELPHVVVNTEFQNIRTGPGSQFTVIASVSGGTVLDAIGVTPDNSWYLVRGIFGQGWISSDFVLFRGAFRNVPIIHAAY